MPASAPHLPTHRAVETVFRIERTRLIAGLAARTRDVALAEDLAQEALIVALDDWPRRGIPDNPGAWLMATAKRRAVDLFRRCRMQDRKHAEIAAEGEEGAAPDMAAWLDDDIGDEVLALVFTACHPVLSPEARAALTLRLVAGLTVAEIARAYLSAEAAIARRITRAKAAIAEARVPFEVPRGAERRARLSSVLEVVYLIFNEGYAATAGDAPVRRELAAEAQRLGRLLAQRLPDEAEVWGLLALMELQASRLPARVGADGVPVPLPDQLSARWDRLMLRRGLVALERAETLGGAGGDYALQARIAACHAATLTGRPTDWRRIAALYDDLIEVRKTPVVALARAIAWSMAEGPEEGLVHLTDIEEAGVLPGYAPLHAAFGDCHFRAGRPDAARAAFTRAATLSANAAERAFLLRRAAACDGA
ncbi:RNA polymerase sigma factor [Wenxinia marina]|uniref:RNA polymerase, sigma subunit, ECF family n=1 Tax=Wenxinia marina DSM 24838 TaxID=1123501 RepID=A0A0D0PGC9_9RHOB|nr:sigma-70 family RNA polymerase sigma factor [Wenxinia marina]KIQ70411.1 RNA polymerase, sigma subunit, ECF family [Wenxinia marina DSM 24838]GGL53396.1 RNA polymerase subunit sigma-24 [Wenxinia marina]